MTTELHQWENVTKYMHRLAVPGGWIYQDRNCEPYHSVPVADPAAPHCRPKVRRFMLREGYRESNPDTGYTVFGKPVKAGPYGRENYGAPCVWRVHGVWEVSHVDGSMSYHATQPEAHDALGPDSPWVEVTP